jgi:predicted MFS family arabinose efflux permease
MLLVPTISRELDVPVSSAQWMLTIMGRLSDGPHKKALLLSALSVILAGSITAALATDFTVFLIGRACQGLTYGIIPVTIAQARRYLPTERVGFGISTLSVTAATGLGVGYPLTGVIAGTLEYQFAFWFASAFVVSAIVVVAVALPRGPDLAAPRTTFDVAGAILLGGGVALLLVAVSEGSSWGWAGTATIGCFAAAAVLLAVWALVELRLEHPLINLRVLGNAEVLLANVTAVGLGTAMYMGLSIGSIIAQAPASTGYGIALPVLWAGFVMLPLSVGSLLANQLTRVFSGRIRMITLIPLGATLVTVSTALLFFAHQELWEILLGMFLFGTGIGTTYAAMPGLIARSVVTEELGSAVSFNQVLRTVGGSFGSAITGAVLAAHIASDGHPSGDGISFALGLAVAGCAGVLAALLIDAALRVRRNHS